MKVISIILINLLLTSVAFGQEAEKIKTIREAVDHINKNSNLKIKFLSNDYFAKMGETTDNGKELKGYYLNSELKKIDYKLGLSVCMKTFIYYYSGDKLVFVFEKEDDYPELKDHSGLDFNKLATAFEGRYYFDNGKLFKTITKGKRRQDEPDKLSILPDLKNKLKSAK